MIKPEIAHVVMEDLMEPDISSIWIKLSRKGGGKLIIGGLYREHQHLGQGGEDISDDIRHQEDRWRRTVKQWQAAAAGAECIVIGDINLDFSRWAAPEQHHINMVEEVKVKIETIGSVR